MVKSSLEMEPGNQQLSFCSTSQSCQPTCNDTREISLNCTESSRGCGLLIVWHDFSVQNEILTSQLNAESSYPQIHCTSKPLVPVFYSTKLSNLNGAGKISRRNTGRRQPNTRQQAENKNVRSTTKRDSASGVFLLFSFFCACFFLVLRREP